ncbi:DUF2513 domain-containing protein, partial [Aeromonas caviae]
MKRDWDTVRDILTKLESLPSTDHYLSLGDFELTDVSDAYAISYHMELLIEAGLVEGKMSRVLGGGPINFTATRLIPIGLNIRSVLSNLGYKVTSPAPHR